VQAIKSIYIKNEKATAAGRMTTVKCTVNNKAKMYFNIAMFSIDNDSRTKKFFTS
jgi:hypothetical protein